MLKSASRNREKKIIAEREKMAYALILEDLKKKVGDKPLLNVRDVAIILHTTKGAIYKLIERGSSSLPFRNEGGFKVSIYDLAKWLDGSTIEKEGKEKSTPSTKSLTPQKLSKRFDEPISKTLFNFATCLADRREELDFLSEIFRELEDIELRNSIQDAKAGNKPPL